MRARHVFAILEGKRESARRWRGECGQWWSSICPGILQIQEGMNSDNCRENSRLGPVPFARAYNQVRKRIDFFFSFFKKMKKKKGARVNRLRIILDFLTWCRESSMNNSDAEVE